MARKTMVSRPEELRRLRKRKSIFIAAPKSFLQNYNLQIIIHDDHSTHARNKQTWLNLRRDSEVGCHGGNPRKLHSYVMFLRPKWVPSF